MSVQPTTVATFTGLGSGINTDAIISSMQQFAQQQISQLTTESQGLNTQLEAYQSFNTTLSALQTAAQSISSASTFQSNTATSSNTAVATISATAGATDGTYSLTVNSLAQAQEIVSNAYGSNNLGLNETGTFTINGRAIDVDSGDSLSSIASKINSANAGVTASVVATGANQYQLSLTSNQTGAAHAISAVDTSGTVLGDLGLVNDSTGTSGPLQTVGTDGAASITASSATEALGGLFGYSSGDAPSGTVTISNGNGGSGTVDIDYNTDSLSSIANKINAAGISGITASVVALPDANGNVGGGGEQLEINNADGGPPQFADSNSVLASLGFIQQSTATANEPVSAQDANFEFNGLTYTRSSNTIGDLIPGASVTLLSQTPTTGYNPTPATTSLTVAQNTSGIVTAVQNFVSAYNNAIDYVDQQNTFSAPTGDTKGTQDSSPPLFGSAVLQQVQQQLQTAIGVSAGTTNLGSIGITSDPTTGELDVNTAQLTSALQDNLSSVQSLFGVIGNTSNSNVQFVSGGTNAKQGVGGNYPVVITTPATQSSATATVAQTSASTQAETLTFSGIDFPSSVALTLNPGNTVQDTVNQINGDSLLNGLIQASVNASGKLEINSTAYGSGTSFSVASNLAAASDNSGIGATPTYFTGTDVQGTIDGEPATGAGQTLTGDASNANTAGLTLTVTATSPGTYGTVSVTQGVGTQLNSVLTSILNTSNGEIANAESALNSQITNNEQQITAANTAISTQEAALQAEFSAMETQISQLQSQSQAFEASAAGLAGTTTSSSSGSTSGSSGSSSSL